MALEDLEDVLDEGRQKGHLHRGGEALNRNRLAEKVDVFDHALWVKVGGRDQPQTKRRRVPSGGRLKGHFADVEERLSALTGDYKPASNTARAITGAMMVQRGGVTFANGVTLYTRTLNPRRGGDLISKNGDSYAAAVVGPGTLGVELRRVTEQVLPDGAVGLCGAEAPQYIALTYDERATVVTMLVDQPGPPTAP